VDADSDEDDDGLGAGFEDDGGERMELYDSVLDRLDEI
jgi:hypothetical protein